MVQHNLVLISVAPAITSVGQTCCKQVDGLTFGFVRDGLTARICCPVMLDPFVTILPRSEMSEIPLVSAML